MLGSNAGATIGGEPAVGGKIEAEIGVEFEAVRVAGLELDHRTCHISPIRLVDADARHGPWLATIADRGKLDRARGPEDVNRVYHPSSASAVRIT